MLRGKTFLKLKCKSVLIEWLFLGKEGMTGAVPMTPQETLLDPFQLMEISSKVSNPDKLTLNKKHWHQSYHLNCLLHSQKFLLKTSLCIDSRRL